MYLSRPLRVWEVQNKTTVIEVYADYFSPFKNVLKDHGKIDHKHFFLFWRFADRESQYIYLSN